MCRLPSVLAATERGERKPRALLTTAGLNPAAAMGVGEGELACGARVSELCAGDKGRLCKGCEGTFLAWRLVVVNLV